MRYLVLSDTHNNITAARDLIEQLHDRIDGVLHMGDMVTDFNKLKNMYQDRYGLAFAGVCGNCDLFSTEPDTRCFTVEGRRVLMFHGHQHGVKYGTRYLKEVAEENKANIVLFGHTHVPLMEEAEGILYLNPGSLSEPRGGSRAGFALLEIEKGKAAAVLYKYEDFC
ncbi:MAG: metallophosphoesterase [Lachnospiraceae bacterium]|nr:metallophosphoesterase [Lachnospiraceae bacterium]